MCKTIVALAICVLAVAAGAEENARPLSPGFPPALALFHAEDKSPTAGNPSYLGVYIRDIRPDRMSELRLKDQHGAEITMVDRDGPAGKAGLKEDDVILSFNGKPVEDADDLRRMIQSTPAGTSVSLGISRDGQPISFNLQLGDRNEALSKRAAKIHIPAMEIPGFSIVEHSRRYGLVVETLSRQLAQYFGAKDGQGILVRSVDKGSPAESAGFNAGDVILRVGNEAIDDVGDWGRILHHSAGQSVAVSILRNHKEHSITFAVPNHHGNGGSADLEFLLPSIDGLQNYFDGFGKNIQQQVEEAMRSKQMQEFWKQQQGNVDQLQRDLARMAPKVDRALHQMQKQMQKAFQEHQHEFGDVY
jgi:membrane-associated protease RseP (regulator of RpoE activity)